MTSQHTYKTTIFSSQNRPESTTIFHSSSTGKEKDSETGYYYFGARYYNSDLSLWLSVDPMADKYPSLSPYNYCAWNPMKVVDPNGMELDGYEGSNGQYQWFENHSEQSFIDENGMTWNRVTGNREAWNEATTIRDANILGLESLGFDRKGVEQDVRLYDGDDPLFTKESKLNNAQKYTDKWEKAVNSDGGRKTAKQSPEIKNTGYSLKFYTKKGGRSGANSLGIVKTSGIGHLFEGGLEAIERVLYGSKADSDPFYDMHYNNAASLIYRLNNRPVRHDEYAPSFNYSNYHRSGGMKLP